MTDTSRLPRPPYMLALAAIEAEGPDRPHARLEDGSFEASEARLAEWKADQAERVNAYLAAGNVVYNGIKDWCRDSPYRLTNAEWHQLRAFLEHHEVALVRLDADIQFVLIGRSVVVDL